MADDPEKLRGLRFDAIVMDEVGDMNPDLWRSVVSKTIRNPHDKERTKEAWVDFIGTPKGMNTFYDLYQKAVQRDYWGDGFYPINVTNLLTEEEIEEEKENSGNEEIFNREFLCDFGASVENVFIPLTLAQPAVGKHIGKELYHMAPKILGVDVGGENDPHVVTKRQGLATFPLIKFYEKDHMIAAAKVAHIITTWEPDAVFIDQGHGYGVISRLRQLGHKVTEVPFGSNADDEDHFLNKRAEMHSRAKDWLREGGALPEDQDLLQQLTCVRIVENTSGKLQLEKKSIVKGRLGRSTDDSDSFVLTFAYTVRPRDYSPVVRTKKRKYSVLGRFKSIGARA